MKPSRGKAKCDEFGRSVRQRAFDYFRQGLRPSQLPPMGVPKATIYRYFQHYKHREKEIQFRLLKQLLTSDSGFREEAAKLFDVQESVFLEALKGARSVEQVKRRLKLEETQELGKLIEEARRLDLKRLTEELRHCSSLEEREAKFREAAHVMGISEEQLIVALDQEIRRMRVRGKGPK